MSASSRVINFSAGPCSVPEFVLHEAAKGLLNFNNTGIGIAEIYRQHSGSREPLNYSPAIKRARDTPYPIHPGRRSCAVYCDHQRVLDYVVTGYFSQLAVDEAHRLGGVRVNVVVDSRTHSKDAKFDNILAHDGSHFRVLTPR
ncbi:hypothetical protein C8F04DRAFT_1287020 [Mycena alexandri]|uniref:Uncharacterized protein n=1 Tax=Mycena alexandri TaxID=1745969 RepID=A0AAD6TEZ3_9AGAR|nr:hypothetical protein C8F04DRAFT_1287020 [Mycena alexandri]